jgi:hypothetical protein
MSEESLSQQLAAAQAALEAERTAHEQTRAERDRACAEQVVAHACMVKAFSAKLEAETERDVARSGLAAMTNRSEHHRQECKAARAALATATAQRDASVLLIDDALASANQARAALARLEGLARAVLDAEGEEVRDAQGEYVGRTIWRDDPALDALRAALPPTPSAPAPCPECEASKAALARLVPLARAAAEAPAKSGDETIALAELIAAVLAAALPPTSAEPPAPARRPPPLVAAVGTNDLGNGEHSPSRVNVAAAEPPAPPRSVDVCACGRRTHWGHCEVCHGGTGGESPCPSSAEPPAPALLPVTGESLRTGELPDGSVTESAIERAAQAWPAMVPAPVAEAGSGVCDECNGEGWIAHPAGTKFGCLHCHMCGGSGKGDL